jgi:hypothetical protein
MEAAPAWPETPFSLQPSTNRDTGAIAASRRSAMMMTEDAKFALGF